MSADILGTSWDQCRSMVQYSFTSTETRRLVMTDSPGRPPRLSHSSWTMIWAVFCFHVAFRPRRRDGLLGTGFGRFSHGPIYRSMVQWSWFSRVNALCNLSRKKSREVAASLMGRFLSRRCFTLCITMEDEPRIAKQYKMPPLLQLQKLPGKGDGGWTKKCLCVVFLADQKIASSWKRCVLGHPIARAIHTFWLRASKNVLKVGSVKFANSLSPPSTVKKVRTGSKSSQGTLAMPSKSQGS